MVKYVLTMLNIGFTKIMRNSTIHLRILYTEYFWILEIEPHIRAINNSIQLYGKYVANTQHTG